MSDRAGGARRPEWLKVRLRTDAGYRRMRSMIGELELNTVCTEARCPNIWECWNAGTATFMILGDTCTRRCGFCSVHSGLPTPGVDAGEPRRVGEAVRRLGLRHAVITSVDRDDLPDGPPRLALPHLGGPARRGRPAP
jgi:lipoic acid synthetase